MYLNVFYGIFLIIEISGGMYVELTREFAIEGIKKVIQRYANASNQHLLEEMSGNILDSGMYVAKYLSQNHKPQDLENLISDFASKSDTYVRKVLSGASLAFAFGMIQLPPDMVGSLSGIYISEIYSNFNSEEKTSIVNMMREMYIFSKDI